ncbi:hypothetical protein RIR_jg40374.t1 [Rhizophagus irregularis DAOM 181602=DAOM 197198]|nr:hypothetical protein RIR_jg40374.t1 [Rhizophagus irregularis DAOM 181602=DAOM 197198]
MRILNFILQPVTKGKARIYLIQFASRRNICLRNDHVGFSEDSEMMVDEGEEDSEMMMDEGEEESDEG